ncbi:MAG: GxxExxY protein [Pedosphaera sp.]|nr:GxxExxY protein [Pedosphaera sp.]
MGAAFDVHNVLGYGFLERVYQRAMQVELTLRKVKVELELKLQVYFKGVIIGDYAADLLVQDRIVVELKAGPEYQPAHEAQLLNELKATQVCLRYLINSGRTKVEYKRMVM